MSSPSFKLFPCIFCTLGYNIYVLAFKLMALVLTPFHKVAKQSQPVEQVDTLNSTKQPKS